MVFHTRESVNSHAFIGLVQLTAFLRNIPKQPLITSPPSRRYASHPTVTMVSKSRNSINTVHHTPLSCIFITEILLSLNLLSLSNLQLCQPFPIPRSIQASPTVTAMALSNVFSLLMVSLLLGFAVAQSPSPSPTAKTPASGEPAPSPLSKPPSHSPPASPTPAPAKSTTPPPSSPSPVLSPPSPPPSAISPSPSVALPPSTAPAPAPHNGAVVSTAGIGAAAAGFLVVALMVWTSPFMLFPEISWSIFVYWQYVLLRFSWDSLRRICLGWSSSFCYISDDYFYLFYYLFYII